MTPAEVSSRFDNIRRAQHAGVYAPHKPLLLLLALARVQRGEPRQVAFADIDTPLKALLAEFGRSGAAKSRHYPFWHLGTDGRGALWDLTGPRHILQRPPAATPTIGELRSQHVAGGFAPEIDDALRRNPGLLQDVATRVLEACFPASLHADIAAAVGLDLERPPQIHDASLSVDHYDTALRRRRNPAFRERVLRAYEYRCCVCGFDLRIGAASAGLEAAHIHWHHMGGPDIEINGLSLCALHHKLFDLGVFTVVPNDWRIVFSQHAITGDRGASGALQHHGQTLLPPQQADLLPAPRFLEWNLKNVFKTPGRVVTAALGTTAQGMQR